jgi:hypothetical protein
MSQLLKQEINLNEEQKSAISHLPALPLSIEGLTYGDIPIKYIKQGNFLPFQSLNVDCTPPIFF